MPWVKSRQAILDLAVEQSLAIHLPTGGAVAEPTSRQADLKTIRLQGNPKRNGTRKPESWVPFFCSQSIRAVCFMPHTFQKGVADSLRVP